ncbi:uncharacterized protein LOC129171388 isoform X2 [Dunckerocampus dactyliophorus]|uniref:uncharacterized protein LOC129171388 isoform X2 n=1 Tax=Dunckerocampus dactyliophorus TaxID=161453 RepID=UPI00240507DE|nr:uncharacterized protein LOC129171388 isoform X2 [Dunckerocampus dactyliophorus]
MFSFLPSRLWPSADLKMKGCGCLTLGEQLPPRRHAYNFSTSQGEKCGIGPAFQLESITCSHTRAVVATPEGLRASLCASLNLESSIYIVHCRFGVKKEDRHTLAPHITQLSAVLTSEAMAQTAEAVSATLSTNRNCTIEITNVSGSYCLINPKVYMSSGICHHPPQPTIRSTRTEVCSFNKDDHTATGAVGLLTYDLFHMQSRVCSQRMAVMFSVPYDHNLYKNRLAVGVMEQSHACDKKLYEQMYDGKNPDHFSRADASGSGLEYSGKYVDVRATMSTVGKAIVKVELYDQMSR